MSVWVEVPVNGINRNVLVQCFERRCLTYTPSNPENWQVEMGNIGRHYLQWVQSSRIHSLYEMPHVLDRAAPQHRDDQAAGEDSRSGRISLGL